MRFKEFFHSDKVIQDLGSWHSGKTVKKLLELSKEKLNLGAQWTWRKILIKAGDHNFVVVIAFHPEKQNYQAYLALLGASDCLVLARIENHSTHPGWHLHVTQQSLI